MGMGEDELSRILAGTDELALGTIVRLEAALGFRLDGGFRHREPVATCGTTNGRRRQMGFRRLDDLNEDTSTWTRGDCYLCYRNLAHMVDHALVDDVWARRLAGVDFSTCDNLVRTLAVAAVGDHPRRRAVLSADQRAALDAAEPVLGGLVLDAGRISLGACATSLGVSL